MTTREVLVTVVVDLTFTVVDDAGPNTVCEKVVKDGEFAISE